MRYTFHWDPVKAKQNHRKHGVTFERAAELFLDPLAVSVVDQEHSESEERWVTLGRDKQGTLLVVVHTFSESSVEEWKIRIISARRSTKRETDQYQEGDEKGI
ncbi:MAG TPA: BrnT family toxin [Terriglobia bacterium]|nr:BrnT family toxin [Terriglobia bacterium]